jgi:hypothetical protein
VSIESGEIVVADNGSGLPPETVEGILDYSSRVSSREAYVSSSIIDFVETKFAEYDVTKLIPDEAVMEQHARRIIERQLLARAIAKISGEVAEQAKKIELPAALREQIEAAFKEEPATSWDAAVAQIVLHKQRVAD